jgi:hypothetical protein
MVKLSLLTLQAVAPQFFKLCPYSGVIIANITFPRQLVLMYPEGKFKGKISVFNGHDGMVLTKLSTEFEKN